LQSNVPEQQKKTAKLTLEVTKFAEMLGQAGSMG
jgi:hypothetical protein